jgi:hypothetical protein
MELLAVNEFTDHLLLVLSIEPPDVKTHQGKFLQLFFLVDISLVSAVNTSSIMLTISVGKRCALSRSSHDMIDSSLTTPLPHLKSLYCTHMGGLA